MSPSCDNGNLDITNGKTAMLDIDPETVELPGHTQVLDDVVVKHPPHGEDDESLATLDSLLERFGHDVAPDRLFDRMYDPAR